MTTTQAFVWVVVCSMLGLVLSYVFIHDTREFVLLEKQQQRKHLQTETGRTAGRATKNSDVASCRHTRISTKNTDINDDDDDDDDNDNGFNRTEASLVGYSDSHEEGEEEAVEDNFVDDYHTESVASRSSRMTTEESPFSVSSSFDAIVRQTCYTNRSYGGNLSRGLDHECDHRIRVGV